MWPILWKEKSDFAISKKEISVKNCNSEVKMRKLINKDNQVDQKMQEEKALGMKCEARLESG
jgi:hypothetical protein